MTRFFDDDAGSFDVDDRTPNITELRPPDALDWPVKPKSGRASWNMDLKVFAEGDPGGGISARPALIRQLAPAVRAGSIGKADHEGAQIKSTLKYLWRMLDTLDLSGNAPLNDLALITNAHGQLFKTILLRDYQFKPTYARGVFGRIRRWMMHARKLANGPELIWPTIRDERGTIHKDVDPRLLRPLYSYLKGVHAGFLGALDEGRQLASIGVDPRYARGPKFEIWSSSANWAYFAQKFVSASLVAGALPMRKFAGRPVPDRTLSVAQPGPSFIPPTVRTHFDAVRWFVPTMADAVAAFTLVMLHTGWNTDTVKNIDISDDSRWFDHRLDGSGDPNTKTATVALYANKGRTGREQIAFSLRNPKSHPFQVIKAMIAATEPLRSHLRNEIEELQRIDRRSDQQQQRLDNIRVIIKSPWLYYTVYEAEGSRVGVIDKSAANEVLRMHFRNAIAASSRLLREFDIEEVMQTVRDFTFSDIRDGFASFIYDNSLFNVLLLKQSLGHSKLRATRAYIRQRRQIADRFRRFTEFQEAVFDELGRFQRVDPTILYMRMSGREVTEGQVQRLRESRLRTRMGMGCLDPESPPEDIAPGHGGGLCAVQRCTLCIHGVVFADSLPDLAIRVAELRFIRTRVAADRFEGSTFQAEWLAVHLIVERLFTQRVDEFEALATSHAKLLENGQAYLFDQVPPSILMSEVQP